VVPVHHGLMAAAGPVTVHVSRMGQVRQRMLVVVPVMRRVRVAIVDVVGVTLALGAGMPAARSVLMLGMDVRVMAGGCHGSSLL
jgi:hypothetical protein